MEPGSQRVTANIEHTNRLMPTSPEFELSAINSNWNAYCSFDSYALSFSLGFYMGIVSFLILHA